jgi:hypothetical protein
VTGTVVSTASSELTGQQCLTQTHTHTAQPCFTICLQATGWTRTSLSPRVLSTQLPASFQPNGAAPGPAKPLQHPTSAWPTHLQIPCDVLARLPPQQAVPAQLPATSACAWQRLQQGDLHNSIEHPSTAIVKNNTQCLAVWCGAPLQLTNRSLHLLLGVGSTSAITSNPCSCI